MIANEISFITKERIEIFEKDKLEDFIILANDNPSILTVYNMRVFPMAVDHNPTKILEYLGQNHKLIISKNNEGNNALHLAVRNRDLRIIKWLCENQLLPANDQNMMGKTALHLLAPLAGCSGYPPEILPLLLGVHGIDPNVLDNNGHTALYYAAENGWFNVVQILAERTAIYRVDEALQEARRYYDYIRDDDNSNRYKVYESLYKQRFTREENSKESKTYEPNIKEWEETITAVMRLIPPLFRVHLSLAELENTIANILNQDILCVFRAKYQNLYLGSKYEVEKIPEKQRKDASDYVKKYDEEIIPVFHVLKYLEEVIGKVRFSDINENNKEDVRKYGDALLTLTSGNTKKLEVTTASDDKGEIKNRELAQLRQERGGHLDQELKYYDKLRKKFPEFPPLPKGVILTKELFSNRLLKAIKRKIEKYGHSDWLVIAIDMGCWPDEPRQNGWPMFYAACKDFGNIIKTLPDIKFKRVFVFLENEHTDLYRVWDSGVL